MLIVKTIIKNGGFMELSQELSNNILLNNNDLELKQNKFIDSTVGKIVNAGLDAGIRLVLPNFIEDDIINIKDQILKNGFKSGINEAIQSAKNLRKIYGWNCYRQL